LIRHAKPIYTINSKKGLHLPDKGWWLVFQPKAISDV